MNKRLKTSIILSLVVSSNMAHANFSDWSEMLKAKSQEALTWAKDMKEKINKDKLKGNITVCLASEKREWGEEVIPMFEKKYPKVSVNVIYQGSGTLMDKLNDNNANQCSLVSPASSVSALSYTDYNADNAVELFYSPLVMVSNTEKLKVLEKTLGEKLNLSNVNKYSGKKWSEISSEHKSWGKNRVAFTNPDKSNSGLVTIMSKAYAFFDAYEPITLKELNDEKFQTEMKSFWDNTEHSKVSTSKLTKSFLVSTLRYSTIFTYENMVPTLLKKHGKKLTVTYPTYAVLNDHPAWITAKEANEKKISQVMINFFLSKEAQSVAAKFAFRPSHPEVSVSPTLSSFYQRDIGIVDLPVKNEIIEAIKDTAKGKW